MRIVRRTVRCILSLQPTDRQPPKPMPRPDAYLPQLTGIRAIAAYCVFLHHYKPVSAALWHGWPARFIEELHIGVWIFYVLSGFLIYYRYAADFEQWSVGHMRQYARNRIARIFPVYYLLLFVSYLVYEFPSPKLAAIQLTLTQGFFPKYAATGIAQAWTLTVEETFYFTAPLLFFFARRWTLLVPCLVLPAIGIVIDYQLGTPFALLRTLLGAIFAFAAGSYIAKHFMRSNTTPRRKPLAWVTYTGVLACGAGVLAMSLVSGPPKLAIHLVLLPATIAWAFWGLLTERSLLSSLLSTPLLVLLGSSSYSFYLIHLGATADLFQAIVSDRVWVLFLGLNVISIGLYKVFERPVNRWLRNLGRAKTEKPVAAGAVPADFVDRFLARFGPPRVAFALAIIVAAGVFLAWSPLQSRVLQVRGEWLMSQERFDEASRVLVNSLAAWPENVDAAVLAAQADYVQGNFTATSERLQGVIKKHPEDAQAQLYFGLAQLELGDVESAVDHVRHAVELRPDNIESRSTLGMLTMRTGRLEEAKQQFQALVRLHPRSAEYRYKLATIFLAQKQNDEARTELEKALELDPDHAAALELLQRMNPQAGLILTVPSDFAVANHVLRFVAHG